MAQACVYASSPAQRPPWLRFAQGPQPAVNDSVIQCLAWPGSIPPLHAWIRYGVHIGVCVCVLRTRSTSSTSTSSVGE